VTTHNIDVFFSTFCNTQEDILLNTSCHAKNLVGHGYDSIMADEAAVENDNENDDSVRIDCMNF